MRRIQASPWCKGAAVLLLLVFSALAGLFGSFVLRGLLYQGADSWQDTYRFQTLLQERQDDVASLAALALETGQLPQGLYFDEDQWAGAVAQWEAEGKDFWPDSTPDYWAMQQYERSIADLAALLDPDQTWFRFQVCSADGAWVLGGNLAPGERLEEAADTVHYAFFYLGNYWTAEDAVLLDALYSEEAESAYSESAVPADNRVELAVVCGVARAMDDTVQDDFWALFVDYGEERANFDVHVTGFANFLSLTILCALFLLWAGGHRRGTEGIVLTWQDRIFLEPYLAVMIAAGVGLLAAAFQSGEYLVRLWEGSVSDASLDELAVRIFTALFVCRGAGQAAVLTLTLRSPCVRI